MRSESSLRALAKREGYRVVKSRRPISLDNVGEYMVVEARTGISQLGHRYDATLDEIADWLKS